LECFVIILLFLLAVFILFNRIKRFLRDLYQPIYKNESKAFKEKAGVEKEKEL